MARDGYVDLLLSQVTAPAALLSTLLSRAGFAGGWLLEFPSAHGCQERPIFSARGIPAVVDPHVKVLYSLMGQAALL